MKKLFFTLIITSFTVAGPCFSQSFYKKWGKLSAKEKELTISTLDSTANAVILGEYGSIKVDYGNIFIHVYVRKKILNKNGFNEADITLPYYAKNDVEHIKGLKAQTINQLPNGKTVVSDVDKEDIFTIDINENWKSKRFTFPAVKEGSIIEYRYTKVSQRYYYLDEWHFQKEIPVLHSELEVIFPNAMEYMSFLSGAKLASKYQGKATNKFELKDLPPVKDQRFVYNIENYTEKIRFQLKSYIQSSVSGGSERVDVIQSWDKLAQEILKDFQYNTFARSEKHFQEIVDGLGIASMTPIEKIEYLHDYVANNFRWNEKNGIYNTQKLKQFLDSKSGNTAEINSYLIQLLKAAGIEAYPMLIATRNYGTIIKSYPLLSQFNRMLAYVEFGDQTFVMNAINEYRPYKLPSLNDYVDEGFVLKEEDSEWVSININHNSMSAYLVYVHFDEEGHPTFDFSSRYIGYDAQFMRTGLNHSGQNFAYQVIKNNNIEKRDSIQVLNLDSVSAPLNVNFKYRNRESSMVNNEIIYFDPFIFDEFQDNPFNDERKDYPIELPYESNFNLVMSIKIPKNYRVEGIPSNEQFTMPGNAASFIYRSSVSEEHVMINIKVNFTKRTLPRNYNDYMKEFYDILNEKINEQIVFKRIVG